MNIPHSIEQSENSIPLKPLSSRMFNRQCFIVYQGTDATGPVRFLEVIDNGFVVRGVNGEMIERWWYERLINFALIPKTKILFFWRRNGNQTILHKYYAKKVRSFT